MLCAHPAANVRRTNQSGHHSWLIKGRLKNSTEPDGTGLPMVGGHLPTIHPECLFKTSRQPGRDSSPRFQAGLDCQSVEGEGKSNGQKAEGGGRLKVTAPLSRMHNLFGRAAIVTNTQPATNSAARSQAIPLWESTIRQRFRGKRNMAPAVARWKDFVPGFCCHRRLRRFSKVSLSAVRPTPAGKIPSCEPVTCHRAIMVR